MLDRVFSIATLLAALGSGLVAGVFFAFSSFVMRALARLPPPQGIAAMQSINIVVINRAFFAAFLGTAALCVALAIGTLVARRGDPATLFVLGGCVLYLVGVILVTGAFNIPRNDILAALVPDAPSAAEDWARYVREWTAWNHVRTVASLAAAMAFTVALCKSSIDLPDHSGRRFARPHSITQAFRAGQGETAVVASAAKTHDDPGHR